MEENVNYNKVESLLTERRLLKENVKLFEKELENQPHVVVGNIHLDTHSGVRYRKNIIEECCKIVSYYLDKSLVDVDSELSELVVSDKIV